MSAKLIALMVGLVVGGSAVIGAITFFATRAALLSAVDVQLQSSSWNYVTCMEQYHVGSSGPQAPAPGPASDFCSRGQPQGMLGVRTKDGHVTNCSVIAGRTADVCKPDAADTRLLLALHAANAFRPGTSGSGGQPQDGDDQHQPPPGWIRPPVQGADFSSATMAGSYRITAVQGKDGDTLITGLPVSGVNHQLGEVAMAELIVFAGVLALAILLGATLVRLSLRPLRRVAATATQVAELPLDSGAVSLPPGVPDSDPRTEVGQLGAAFNRMLGHVERALSRRAASEARLRRFAADASHELRTPLSAIRGYAEFGLRYRGPVPDDVRHALQRVQSASARMSVLVDDLLLLARLDAGRPLEREPVDLTRLAIDAASDARAAYPHHRWRLDLPGEEVGVTGDDHRLHQVLANLLSNAGKHTPAGTTVTIAVRGPDAAGGLEGDFRRGSVPEPPRAEISVTDDGPGVPAQTLPELFERFARADTARSWPEEGTDNGGAGSSTGLGLAIVDAVVAAHHGCITVTSGPGGTRFTIVLPVFP